MSRLIRRSVRLLQVPASRFRRLRRLGLEAVVQFRHRLVVDPVLVAHPLARLAAARLLVVVVVLAARVSLSPVPVLPLGEVVVVLVDALVDVRVAPVSVLRAERVVVVAVAKNSRRWTRRPIPPRTHPFLRERLLSSVPRPRLILVRS